MSDKQEGRNTTEKHSQFLKTKINFLLSQSQPVSQNWKFQILHIVHLHFQRQVHRCSICPFFAFRPLTDVHYVDGEDDDDGDGENDDIYIMMSVCLCVCL